MNRRDNIIATKASGVVVCPGYGQEQEEERITNITNGVVTGIVVSNNDPENLNRVKVRFPWLHSTNNETDWVRVRRFMTSKEGEYTNYFQLNIGNTVLVAFERGDIRHPYVIGVIWDNGSSETGPPYIEAKQREITMPRIKNLSIGDHQIYYGATRDKRA